MAQTDVIYIPVSGSDGEFVEIPVNDLPADVDDLIGLLEDEIASVDLWLECAVQYYKKGNLPAFWKILSRFEGSDSAFGDDRSSHITVLNALAAYYAKMAHRTAQSGDQKSKRQELFHKNTQLLNTASRLDSTHEMTWAVKGVSYLYKGEFGNAIKSFMNILAQDAEHIPALLGKAACLAEEKRFGEALKIYQDVLNLNAHIEPSVRLGIARCFYRLNRPSLAVKALDRVLELNPPTWLHVETLVDLACIRRNEGNDKEAFAYAKQAHEMDAKHPRTLCFLATTFIHQGEHKKAMSLATKAYRTSVIPRVTGEAAYLVGRCYHARGDLANALKFVALGVQKWPENAAIQFEYAKLCYAQSLLKADRSTEERAVKALEHVLQVVPDERSALTLLGMLLAKRGSPEDSKKANVYLRKAGEGDESDVDVQALLARASLNEAENPEGALNLYVRAKEVLERRQERVPKELYNNMGVLQHHLKKVKEAEQSFIEALHGDVEGATVLEGDAMDIDGGEAIVTCRLDVEKALPTLLLPANVSVLFNLALLYESADRVKDAQTIYQAIITAFPTYADAYARMGYLARNESYERAKAWLAEAGAVNEKMRGACALAMGSIALDESKYHEAQQLFEAEGKSDKRNSYANLQLGNIFLNAARDTSQTEKRDKHLQHAMDFFFTVLGKDQSNIYAANGLAIVLQEKGFHTEAREAFGQVREATRHVPDVFINLGHMNLLDGNFMAALKLYENALENASARVKGEVFVCMAKCHFELKQLDECEAVLQRALETSPNDRDVLFNLALVHKERATQLFSDKAPTVDKMARALSEFRKAAPIFNELASIDGPVKRMYSTTKSNKFARLCERNAELAESKLEGLKEEAEELAKKLDERKKQMEETRREREKKEEEERKAREAREAELRKIAEETDKRAEAIKLERMRREEEKLLQSQQRKRTTGEPTVKKPKKLKEKKKKGRQVEYSNEDDGEFNPDAQGKSEEEVVYQEGAHEESEEPEAMDSEFSEEEVTKKSKKRGREKKKSEKKPRKKRRLARKVAATPMEGGEELLSDDDMLMDEGGEVTQALNGENEEVQEKEGGTDVAADDLMGHMEPAPGEDLGGLLDAEDEDLFS